MKSLICAVAILAAVVAAVATSTGTLTMDIYSEDNCGGSILHSVSPKLDTCDTRGGHHHGGRAAALADRPRAESFMMSTPVAGDVAHFAHASGANCSSAGPSEFMACGVCTATRETGKFAMLHCSLSGQYVTFSHDCNEGCATCTHDHEKIAVGACHADKRNATREMELVSITTGYTFQAKEWATSTTCSGTPSHEETHATNVCDRRVKFIWSA
jgi:hypothetical protein